MDKGFPRPLYTGLPVPYNVDETQKQGKTHYNFGGTDYLRSKEIVKKSLCQICGLPLEERCIIVISLTDLAQNIKAENAYPDSSLASVMDEGGLHLKRCWPLAKYWCPHLREHSNEILVLEVATEELVGGYINIKLLPEEILNGLRNSL